jgi:DNA-directed RNA polymerase specialized sigma24 family protein
MQHRARTSAPSPPAHLSAEARQWHAKLARAQEAMDRAEANRDELVRQALAHGVGVRAVAELLGINKGTVSRRYGGSTQ